MTADSYFKNLEPPIKDIAIELRSIIKGLSTEFKEEIKWNVPTYIINKNVCSIMAHKKHVNLQVMNGAKLKDGNKLEGTGKGMRHLKFTTKEDIDSRLIEKILKQAIKLNS